MILNNRGQKRTANELAKELVYFHGASVTLCWKDYIPITYWDNFTPHEEKLVAAAIEKQLVRTRKILRI